MSSSAKAQDDLIVFQNIRSSYPPSEDVEVRFNRKDETTLNSHDWVGVFRVGWTSAKDYYTFEWAPMPVKNGEERSDLKVVFSGRRLPQDDGQKYQFCYINRNGTLYGSSVPFQITKAMPKSNSRETNAANDTRRESALVLPSDGGVGQALPYRDEENDSLIVITSLRRDLARSVEDRKAVEAECEKLKQQGSNATETLMLRQREMQMTREQMESLVKKLSGKIDQLEERLMEKQKLCVSEMEWHSHQLASESSQLNQKLSECVAEVQMLKERLECEGGLRKKLEQQLLAVEMLTKSMKSTTALQKEVHNIVSSFSNGGQYNAPTDTSNEIHSAKSNKCSSTASEVSHNALEAMQLAYGTIEKYYHTTCAQLEACQTKLRESENKAALLQQRCMELEAQIPSESNTTVIKQTPSKQAPSSSGAIHDGNLEQRLEESEQRCKMLTSGEELCKRKIEELECQLHDEKKNVKIHSDDEDKHDIVVSPVEYEGIFLQLKELAERLKSKNADSDIRYLLNKLEVVVAEIRGIYKGYVIVPQNNDGASNNAEESQAGFRQCPVCQLEFPQTMTQKKFERHIRKHQKE
ncbi:hypothetical protein EMCRGX_G005227 [Ephydatia muelleri]